jgi:hypothetical protein
MRSREPPSQGDYQAVAMLSRAADRAATRAEEL